MIGLIPPVAEMIGHDLCKYLLQNSQSETVPILSLTLRVIFNLFSSSVKEKLKVQVRPFAVSHLQCYTHFCIFIAFSYAQLEVFFNTIHLRIPIPTSTLDDADDEIPFDKKELVLESLVEFCSEPELMVDLFCNYDLDLSSSNLFEKLIEFLATHAFSDSGDFTSLHRLCLEALLAVVDSLNQKFCHPSAAARFVDDDSDDDSLTRTKAEKRLLSQAAEQWNKNKKKSLGTLASMGVIASAMDAAEVAKFFRNTPGLNLDSIGEYFGKINDDFHRAVFSEFVKTFDFVGSTLDLALRRFLESFKLPGEAQQIDMILDAFAARYFEHNSTAAANADTIFILAFSIIMLNTDLHNDGVKNKMTIEEFIRNNRGIDDGKDLPKEFLEGIYNEIQENEIKMTPDVENLESMDDKQWEQLLRSASGGDHISSGGATLAVGRDMFALIWQHVISAMCMSLDATSLVHDERVIHKVLVAFKHVAFIACFFKQPDVLNNAVVSLCKSMRKQLNLLSGLIERAGPAAAFRDSTSKKALQITQTLFAIVNSHYGLLREAWLNVIECVVLLNRGHLSLLPVDLTDVDDFVDASGHPLPSSVSQLAAEQRRTDGQESLSTSFLNLFFPPEEEEQEDARAEDQEAQRAMQGMVAHCNISSIFSASKQSAPDALPYLINSLIHCSGGTGAHIDTAMGNPNASTPIVGAESAFNDELLSQIYCLEWLTNVCRHNQHRMDVVWPLVSSYFESGLAAVSSSSVDVGNTARPRLFLERMVVSILRLCCYFDDGVTVSSPRGPRSPVDTVFATLRPLLSLPRPVLLALGSRVTSGLLMLLRSNGSMLREKCSWEMVFEICQTYAQHSASSHSALESLHHVITNHQELFTTSGPQFMRVLLLTASFSSSNSPVERSHTVVASLFCMLQTLAVGSCCDAAANSLSQNEWSERWIQTLVWLATACLDPRPAAHNFAAATLQKALFASSVNVHSGTLIRRCFDEVFYRLLPELVKHFGPNDDMRVKLFNLMSQALLHNLPILRTLPDLTTFLASYFTFVDTYFRANHDGAVTDSICGILRNTLLVTNAEGVLSAREVWTAASPLIESFCPHIDLASNASPVADKKSTDTAAVSRTTAVATAGGVPSAAGAENQLAGMKVSALQKLALAEGIAEAMIDDTMEAARPKDELIRLILRFRSTLPAPAPVASELATPSETLTTPSEAHPNVKCVPPAKEAGSVLDKPSDATDSTVVESAVTPAVG